MAGIRIFDSGLQFGEWMKNNCDLCKMGFDNNVFQSPPECPVEYALSIAPFNDGTVTPEIAKRAGMNEKTKGNYIWPCSEQVFIDDVDPEIVKGLVKHGWNETTVEVQQ